MSLCGGAFLKTSASLDFQILFIPNHVALCFWGALKALTLQFGGSLSISLCLYTHHMEERLDVWQENLWPLEEVLRAMECKSTNGSSTELIQ